MPDVKDVLAGLGIIPQEQPQTQSAATAPAPDPAQAVVDAVLSTTQPATETLQGTPRKPASPPPGMKDLAAPDETTSSAAPVAPAAAPPVAGSPAEPAAPSQWDAVLDGPKAVTFTEDENKVFQARFGKKADEFVSEHNKLQEELRTVRTAAAEYEAFKKSWEGAPLEIRNAFDRALAGENWKDYLTKTPSFDWSAPAEKQNRVALIDHYLPGSISEEDREVLATGGKDVVVEARINALAAAAGKLFEPERQAHLGQIEQRNAQIQKEREEVASSVDASFAYVREKYPALAPELTDELKADMISFKAPFDIVMSSNGRGYSPEATFRLIVAKNLDKVLARVAERSRVQGRNEGIQEASQTIPATARVAGAAAPIAPNAQVSDDPVMSLVEQVNNKVRMSQGRDPFANKLT